MEDNLKSTVKVNPNNTNNGIFDFDKYNNKDMDAL